MTTCRAFSAAASAAKTKKADRLVHQAFLQGGPMGRPYAFSRVNGNVMFQIAERICTTSKLICPIRKELRFSS